MKQVLEWDTATEATNSSKQVMPTGMLKVQVAGKMYTTAAGALATWAAANRPCLDGSAYMGIQFNVTGNVTALRFQVETPATLPIAEGGVCNSATACEYANYQKDITADQKGALVKVAFMDLKAAFGTPAAFDAHNLVSIVFVTTDTNVAHSFTVDNISFY
jgi:hypothetical protein